MLKLCALDEKCPFAYAGIQLDIDNQGQANAGCVFSKSKDAISQLFPLYPSYTNHAAWKWE